MLGSVRVPIPNPPAVFEAVKKQRIQRPRITHPFRAAPVGEYKYITQSLTMTGELMVTTTFLNHTMPNADLDAMLAALSSASHVK